MFAQGSNTYIGCTSFSRKKNNISFIFTVATFCLVSIHHFGPDCKSQQQLDAVPWNMTKVSRVPREWIRKTCKHLNFHLAPIMDQSYPVKYPLDWLGQIFLLVFMAPRSVDFGDQPWICWLISLTFCWDVCAGKLR